MPLVATLPPVQPSNVPPPPAAGPERRLPPWAGWLTAYGLLFAYFYSFLDYGLNLWDEGGFAYGTLRTWRGEMALRDFNPIGYLPGRYLYAAWFFDLFGVSLHSLRLSVAVLTPLMVLLVYAVARRLMPRGFALLAAAMMLSAPSMYYNRFYPFFCVLILWTLVRWLESPRFGRSLALAGAILLCVPFKMEVSLFSALLVLVLYPWRPGVASGQETAPPRAGTRWVLGGVLGLAGVSVLVYFWRYGIFQKFADIVIETRTVWGNPFPDLFPFVELLKTLGPDALFERLMFYLPLGVYAAVMIQVGLRWMRNGSPGLRELTLLAVAGMGLCAYGLVIWRAGFDNLVRTLPAFYILASYLLWQGHTLLVRWFSGRRPSPSRWAPERVLAFFLVALPVLVFLYEMNVVHGFYVGSIGALRHPAEPLELPRARVWAHPFEARWVRGVVRAVERFSQPGDPILALPLNPLFYFLTGRENPIVHDWILPGMLDESGRREVVRQMTVRMPRLVILADIPIDGREERRLRNYAPEIDHFVRQYYRFLGQAGFFQIWIPLGRPGSNPADLTSPFQ